MVKLYSMGMMAVPAQSRKFERPGLQVPPRADRRRTPLPGALVLVACLISPFPSAAQDVVTEARDAIAAGQARRAVELLDAAVRSVPTPDAFLYLGIALANTGDADRALDVLEDGSQRYPTDSRFLDEIAGLYLRARDTTGAVATLAEAIAIDPGDSYAADLLASIRLSEGQVREALGIWNAVGQPEIDQVSQNFAPGLLDRIVPRALDFGRGDTLHFQEWETTRARLFASWLYANVALELEPSPRGERFNAIIRTSARTNTRNDILFDLVRGAFVETTYLDLWNIRRSGLSWRSAYRWDKDRRQLRGQISIPLPLPGLPVVELRDVWRAERWNLERSLGGPGPEALFDYRANALSVRFEATPDYRIQLHGGLEHRNRDVTGSIGIPGMDERNSATFDVGTILRPIDRRYRSQVRLDGFVARKSLLGDFDFSGGTVGLVNRFEIQPSSLTYLDVSLTGGTVRGVIPVDHYFILGLGGLTPFQLRAHVADDAGRYGRAPMGTDFVLLNTDIERRVATVPLFNTLGIPYLHVKLTAFFDAGRTFDRQHVFRQNTWYKDTGAGLRLETPTDAFTILYGRDLAGHENTLYAYVEQNLW